MLLLLAALALADEPAVPTLDVSGTGEVWVEPDEAVLTLGLRAEEKTANAAYSAASAKMDAIVAALGKLVTPERIRTSQLSLQPRYEYPARAARRLVGYEAASTLEIRVDDPSRTGEVLDAAVAAGANDVAGVSFQVEDEAEARRQALDAAVQDATVNATQVAERLGVTLGAPRSVTLRTEGRAPPTPVYERAAADADVGEAMPVLAGEQIYRAQVDVRFTIEEPAQDAQETDGVEEG